VKSPPDHPRIRVRPGYPANLPCTVIADHLGVSACDGRRLRLVRAIAADALPLVETMVLREGALQGNSMVAGCAISRGKAILVDIE